MHEVLKAIKENLMQEPIGETCEGLCVIADQSRSNPKHFRSEDEELERGPIVQRITDEEYQAFMDYLLAHKPKIYESEDCTAYWWKTRAARIRWINKHIKLLSNENT
jgi:hypothetical protein